MSTPLEIVIGMFLGGLSLLVLLGGLIWRAAQQEAREPAEMEPWERLR